MGNGRVKFCIHKVGKVGGDDFLLFSIDNEGLCKAWESELSRAVSYAKRKYEDEDGGDSESLKSEGTGTTEITTELTSEEGDDEMIDEMDEMTLEEMQAAMIDKDSVEETTVDSAKDDAVEMAMLEREKTTVSGRRSSTSEPENYKKEIHAAEHEVKQASTAYQRRKAKKKKKLLLKKCKARENLFNLVMKWYLTYHARRGEVARIKRLLEKVPHQDTTHKEVLEATFKNMARSACRFKHKKLLTWLIRDKDVDVNSTNVMGFPLCTFAISSYGEDDSGELLRYMHRELGAGKSMRQAKRRVP